jgi:hypothetical protein
MGRPNAPVGSRPCFPSAYLTRCLAQENQEYDIPDFAPQNIQPFPAHRNPATGQPEAENFHILADRHAGIVDYRPQPLRVSDPLYRACF